MNKKEQSSSTWSCRKKELRKKYGSFTYLVSCASHQLLENKSLELHEHS